MIWVIYEQEGAPEKALTFYRRRYMQGRAKHISIAGVLKELQTGRSGESFQAGVF